MFRMFVHLLIVFGLVATFVAPVFAQEECPAGYVTLYVNPDTGVDDPAVGTQEQPLKTAEKAIELLGAGNGCVVAIDAAGQQVSLLLVEAPAEAPAEAAAEAPAEAAAEAPAEAAAVDVDAVQPEVPDTGAVLPQSALNLLLIALAAGLVMAGMFIRRRLAHPS